MILIIFIFPFHIRKIKVDFHLFIIYVGEKTYDFNREDDSSLFL
nr:MAG TPA: hypothetical protein [Caudoviricetes sp.]